VALKNILVKQVSDGKNFESIPETELPFDKVFTEDTEEAVIVHYFKHNTNNIITTNSCRKLEDVKNLVSA
jgi:hypothetical protein